MFVEHKEALEVSVKLKLSEAIRKGRTIVSQECKSNYFFCAMGCAWAGYHGRELNGSDLLLLSDKKYESYLQAMASILEIPSEIAQQIEIRHNIRGEPALSIADWLERVGY